MSSRGNVGLRRREDLDRASIEVDGLLIVASHLQFVGFLEEFGSGLARVGHDDESEMTAVEHQQIQ